MIFTECTVVNHHFSPPFGRIVLLVHFFPGASVDFVANPKVWIGFIWAAMYGRKRWNGEDVAWFKTKIASGLVLAVLFWIFPLLEPTCGTTGHWNCYKSCPLGGPGLPYFIFTALYLGTMMGVAMAQDKVPDQASCWFIDRFRKAHEWGLSPMVRLEQRVYLPAEWWNIKTFLGMEIPR